MVNNDRRKNRGAALAREKDLTDRVKQVSLLRVLEHFYSGDEVKKESNGYKVRVNGFLFKIWNDEHLFSSFQKENIPGYNKTKGWGCIEFRIAAERAGGNNLEFRQVRNELAAAFGLSLNPNVRVQPASAHPAIAATPKKREFKEPFFNLPPEVPSYSFGHRWLDLTHFVREYLEKQRALPTELVERLLKDKNAYPTIASKDIIYPDGRKTHIEEPAVVFPMRGLRTPAPVGFAYKTLPLSPRFSSFAASEGYPGYGMFTVNPLNWDKIKHLVFTEGAIDACAKHVLMKAGEDTCVMAFGGARIPNEEEFPDFYRTIAVRGIDLTAAYDSDHAGHKAALRAKEVAGRFGIRFSHDYVKNSEIRLSVRAGTPESAGFLDHLRSFIQKHQLEHLEEVAGPAGGPHVITVKNTMESALEMEEIEKLERRQRSALVDPLHRAARKGNPVFKYEIFNKDWDDELKGQFKPVLQSIPALDPAAKSANRFDEPTIG